MREVPLYDGHLPATSSCFKNNPHSLKLTEVPLLPWDVPLSTFVSAGSALFELRHAPNIRSSFNCSVFVDIHGREMARTTP